MRFANVVMNGMSRHVIKLDEGFLPIASLSKYIAYQSDFGNIEELLLKPSIMGQLNEILQEKREELRPVRLPE